MQYNGPFTTFRFPWILKRMITNACSSGQAPPILFAVRCLCGRAQYDFKQFLFSYHSCCEIRALGVGALYMNASLSTRPRALLSGL
jgi:hypothetical protein